MRHVLHAGAMPSLLALGAAALWACSETWALLRARLDDDWQDWRDDASD